MAGDRTPPQNEWLSAGRARAANGHKHKIVLPGQRQTAQPAPSYKSFLFVPKGVHTPACWTCRETRAAPSSAQMQVVQQIRREEKRKKKKLKKKIKATLGLEEAEPEKYLK